MLSFFLGTPWEVFCIPEGVHGKFSVPLKEGFLCILLTFRKVFFRDPFVSPSYRYFFREPPEGSQGFLLLGLLLLLKGPYILPGERSKVFCRPPLLVGLVSLFYILNR